MWWKRNGISSVGDPLTLFAHAKKVDHVASLERAAHTALYLVHDLHTSSEQVSALTSKLGGTDSSALPSLRTPLDHDTERAQFVMKLAPRIRRLESDTLNCLTQRLEYILKQTQQRREATSELDQEEPNGEEARRTEEVGPP